MSSNPNSRYRYERRGSSQASSRQNHVQPEGLVAASVQQLRPYSHDISSLSKIYFAFAPDNGCFVHTPHGGWSRGLPKELADILRERTIERIWCLAISNSRSGSAPMWFMTFTDRAGCWMNRSENMMTISPDLYDYLQYHIGRRSGRAGIMTRLAFGPKQTGIAWTAEQFSNPISPHVIDGGIYQRLERDVFESGKKVEHMTLGYGEANMMIYKDGTINGSLHGYYELLEGALANVGRGDILFLALSPFVAGHFFLLLSNGRVIFKVSRSYSDELSSLLRSDGLDVRSL